MSDCFSLSTVGLGPLFLSVWARWTCTLNTLLLVCPSHPEQSREQVLSLQEFDHTLRQEQLKDRKGEPYSRRETEAWHDLPSIA